MKIKEAKICENGDFDVTVSFTSKEIMEVGYDSLWVVHSKELIQSICTQVLRSMKESEKWQSVENVKKGRFY